MGSLPQPLVGSKPSLSSHSLHPTRETAVNCKFMQGAARGI